MRVAVCDDDASMREYYTGLIRLIAENRKLSVFIDEYEQAEQLLFALADKKDPPDIAFLDIFMPGENGISLGTQMRKEGFIGSIIYLTRSKEHMLPAFDVGASNYIIKGHEYEDARFERVFLRAADEVKKKKRKYLLLNGISEHRNIAIESIYYFEVNKHICLVHYGAGESFEFISSLGKIENTLLAYQFMRVHKSFLVNCKEVKSYTFKEIVMSNAARVPVGRKYSADFRQLMDDCAEVNLNKPLDGEKVSVS